jgi:2-polyprenyl-3-methyl-5-hydroxy-6-metoxy-1,4-benzoquinol methylase
MASSFSPNVPPCTPSVYWEDRARRFAVHGDGLGAVCSYGMPAFYNGYIHWLQQRALESWLQVRPGARVLEIGCGVGRWSLPLARAGAQVTGLDLSAPMVAEARRRAADQGLSAGCRFMVADVAEFDLGERFDLILSVTVLQHVLDPWRFRRSVDRLASHLSASGRMILLEAAPSKPIARCDTAIFVAREELMYLDAFDDAGLRCIAVRGLDPAPFKTWLLPWYRRLPRPMARAGLLAATVAALPIDAIGARWLTRASWHKVFVLSHRAVEP